MLEEELKDSPDTNSEEYLDKLADNTDVATNRERPMSAPAEKTEAAPAKEAYEFVHNGKTVKATREQLIKYAQQGYDYPQKAQKLNQERTKWEQERQQWEKNWGIYKQVDEYAKTNKDWWEFVNQNWNNRGAVANGQQNAQSNPSAGAANDPYAPKFQALEQKLQQFEPLIQQMAEERQQAHIKAEDEKLDQEIRSMREMHKDLDWTSIDDDGKTLELKILEHAQTTGIPTFRAAMRDLLHEQLVGRAESQGKLAIAKGIQQKTKLGVLGESPTSARLMSRNQKPMRNTSYEELESEIREEIRQGRIG